MKTLLYAPLELASEPGGAHLIPQRDAWSTLHASAYVITLPHKAWTSLYIRVTSNVTDRDLETDRDMERFVEPHTPALSRLSLHTADRRAPKFNMALTNRAKSDREEAIQRDLEKREQENTPFDDLTLEFGIQRLRYTIASVE